MDQDVITDQLPQEHKDALGSKLPGWIAWILAHDCDLAPLLRKTIPLIPGLTSREVKAIVAVLDIVCPQTP